MIRTLIAGALLTAAAATSALAADASAGQKVFKSQCSICHSAVKGNNGLGPSLFGVYGTKAGQVPGYKFSEANEKSGLVLDAATLDKYLENPRGVVPGTKMTYAGLKNADQRADLIAYLASLH